MANTTSKVDNLDICTAIVNINGVAAANIKAMNVWDKKSCAPEPTCAAINLSYREGGTACAGRSCSTYYTDGTVGSLTAGDSIFTNENCSECAPAGNYSDRPCRGAQGANFVIEEECVITEVTEC